MIDFGLDIKENNGCGLGEGSSFVGNGFGSGFGCPDGTGRGEGYGSGHTDLKGNGSGCTMLDTLKKHVGMIGDHD